MKPISSGKATPIIAPIMAAPNPAATARKRRGGSWKASIGRIGLALDPVTHELIYPEISGCALVMARSKNSAGVDVTLSVRALEFLEYLAFVQGTADGRTPTGIATKWIADEMSRRVKKDLYRKYWEQGLPPFPPKPAPDQLAE